MELQEIVEQAEKAEDLMAMIIEHEIVLKNWKASLRTMVEETIPSMLIEAGIKEISLESGAQVGLKQTFAVSMPAAGGIEKAKGDKKAELITRLNGGLDWLRGNDGADIIKNKIACEFPAGEDDKANELFEYLKEHDLNPVSSQTVHPGTLKSFLKEKWDKDVEIPDKWFQTYTGQMAEIHLPKPGEPGK